jgi:hypothetical protein
MADYTRDLKKILREAGCTFERQGKGDNELWYSAITAVRFVVDNGRMRIPHS